MFYFILFNVLSTFTPYTGIMYKSTLFLLYGQEKKTFFYINAFLSQRSVLYELLNILKIQNYIHLNAQL